jgi:hypothetical protein
MMRNCFVREEHDRLIVGSGLFAEWFETDDELRFGPTLTPWGAVTIRMERPRSAPTLYVEGQWHTVAPRIDVAVPGFGVKERVDVSAPLVLKEESADFADVRRC